MKSLMRTKEVCVLCQALVAISLGNVWLAIAEILRSAAVFWGAGILLAVLCAVCLVRTLRTPYEEEWANSINLLFHGIVFGVCLIAAVFYGKEYGFLPKMTGIAEMFRYDFDDGIANAITSFGAVISLIGAAASALVVWMCVMIRRK